MALARGKIIKANNEEPDEIEKQISQVKAFKPAPMLLIIVASIPDP